MLGIVRQQNHTACAPKCFVMQARLYTKRLSLHCICKTHFGERLNRSFMLKGSRTALKPSSRMRCVMVARSLESGPPDAHMPSSIVTPSCTWDVVQLLSIQYQLSKAAGELRLLHTCVVCAIMS